jgi:uncharacterized protein YfaS (alpha-2-macroglobulin family)
MQLLLTILLFPFLIIAKIFKGLLGTLSFQKIENGRIAWLLPSWLKYLVNLAKLNPFRFLLFFVFVIGLVFLTYQAYYYYKNLPKPVEVEAIITPPMIDEQNVYAFNNQNANNNDYDSPPISLPPLKIAFSYTNHKNAVFSEATVLEPTQHQPNLREYMLAEKPSVAPLNAIGTELTSGISLYPSKAGIWKWEDDRRLTFVPDTPWPAGQEYTVEFAPEVFDTQDEFTSNSFTFSTYALQGEIEASDFELAAEDKLKQVYVEMSFNYPVDAKSVEEALHMAYQVEGNQESEAEKYTLSFSEDLLFVTAIVNVPTLPDQARVLEVTFSEGIKSIYGGEATTQVYKSKVLVPDIYSYLKLEDSSIEILPSPENEPEQFILLSFTDPISRAELLNKFSLYLLPNEAKDKQTKTIKKQRWRSPREITNQVLAQAQKLDFLLMPNANDNSKNYQIKLDLEPGRDLYFKIASGLQSENGFIQKAFYDKVVSVPQYPQEVTIAGEGSVLTHSNNQRLAFSTRGVNDVRVSIGKVLDDELYHLVSQTQGDISNPDFYSWHFNESNLAQFSTQFVHINTQKGNVKATNYASVDLNNLVSTSTGGLGLFFVEIKAWNRSQNREIYNVSDKRLVLVTDLGVIVKTSQNKRQDIFVQSIKSGKPIANAVVELVAKNGTTLFNKTTNKQGHANFPSASDYNHAQQPVVYVVKHEGDVSFIPYNRYTRQINYSRFDVGGEYSYDNNNERVNAYMFTDRGIYRPGESVNIGMIVKGKGFQNLDNIPLELVVHDAQYTEVFAEKITLSEMGFIESTFDTQKNFTTGSYNATLHLIRDRNGRPEYRDRQVGSLAFSVEAFQADTMSITSEVIDLPKKGWLSATSLTNTVTLSNLYGVPASGRRITSELSLSPMQFSFKEFTGVQFYSPKIQDDTHDGLKRISETLKNETSNADGQANVEVDLSRFTKGTYQLALRTNGFEASGGRSVSVNTRLLYSPSAYLLGYKTNGKLDFINIDSQQTIDLIAVNNSLVPLALSDLHLRLSQVKSVSTLVKQYNGRYQYESVDKHELLSEREFALPAAYETLALDTSNAGSFVIEVVNANDEVLLSAQYTVVGESNDNAQLTQNAELKITLDKSDYQQGETIELSIQAPYAGSGLISIESDNLHSFKWFTSPSKNSVQDILIPKGIEGNAYVNVAFVRNLASKEIFTSPLSYAVVPFSIDRSKRILDLKLNVEEIVQPGKPMAIGLALEEDAKVVVFAVDLGILQVAKYLTPNPLAHFLKKRALNVRTMQILDLILPDFALTQMLSAAGGGMEDELAQAEMMMVSGSRMKSTNPFERKIQSPAVFWSGVVDAKKGDNTYSFDVPNDFAGALRVMAIAVGKNTMGHTQQNTLVRGPFILTPNVLNQAAPGDEFDITLSVANLVQSSPQNATVNIQASTSEHISIVGSDTAQMQLSENQEDAVRFRIKASNVLGPANINFTVNMTDIGGKTWQSSRTATLSIRPAMPFEVNISTGVANNGEVALQTPLQMFEAESLSILKASHSPLVITEGLSAYLAEYPHGCTEQIVSQVFPLVGLSNIPKYGPNNEQVAAHFAEVIATLRQRQSYNGGFSYWASSQADDIDVSVYLMHFLIEAQALGFAVPQDMLQSGVRFLNDTAREYIQENPQANIENTKQKVSTPLTLRQLRQRAKIIYLLTRTGIVSSNLLIDLVSTLNQQHKTTWRKDVLSAYIAASFSLLQQSNEAKKLIGEYELRNKGSDNTEFVDQAFAGLAPRIALDSQYLLLLAKHFPEAIETTSKQAVLRITQAIYKGEYNTVSAAYSMLALGAYHTAINGSDAGNGNNTNATSPESLDEKIAFMATINNTKTPLKASYSPFASAIYPYNTSSVSAKTADDSSPLGGDLYYVNMQAGYQSQLPTESIKNGIEIQKAYLNSNGEIATNIQQGDELTIRLRVRASQQAKIDNIAIVDLLPGGFEVIRESVKRKSNRWRSDYIDIRDDRVIFYGDIGKTMSEISYKVKVTAAGTFAVPASFAEAMYDRSVSGYSKASSIVVAQAKE